MRRSQLPALLAMALLSAELPKGKGRKVEPVPTPTPVEPIAGPETRQQRRARERKAWKRGAR